MQARTKLIKTLEQQIEATSDPQIKADLSRQLTKLVTTAKRRGRPRKPEATARLKGNASLLTRIHHNGVDDLSPQNKLIHFQVVEFEKREKEHRKRTGQQLTEVEKKTLWAEVHAFIDAELTNEDRALLADEEQAARQDEHLKG
jgi:hypothetical protein